MDIDQPVRTTPSYPKQSLRVRSTIAVVATVISISLIGGMLGLFEQASSITVASNDRRPATDSFVATQRVATAEASTSL